MASTPTIIQGIDLSSVPQISTAAFMNRQADYNFGDPVTIDSHQARALENDDPADFLSVFEKVYGG